MSTGARLFAAVDLPGPVRASLAGWARSAVGGRDDLRRVAAASLHLTVVFLGHRPATETDALAGALAAAADGPVPLAVGGPLWLAPRRPHVLTVVIADPAGALTALHRRLEAELAAAVGWEPERRAFRPHVTVARVRRGSRVRPVELAAPEPTRFAGEAVTLYRSRLGEGAPRYEAVARVPLPEPG